MSDTSQSPSLGSSVCGGGGYGGGKSPRIQKNTGDDFILFYVIHTEHILD